MHILIAVLHRPTKPTGVCRHAANLAHCLTTLPEITQITVVTGVWQRHYFETVFALAHPKIQIIDIPIQNRSLTRNFWFLFELPRLVKQFNPDLVHLSFPLPFWRSRFTCPVVTTIHDLYPYECPENFGRAQAIFNRLFLRQCVAESDGLTCVSQETMKQLQVFFPDCRDRKTVAVNYNFVDFSQIIPQCPDPFINTAEIPFLLAVAQHRQNKNLDLLIQSYANLLKAGKLPEHTQLVLVGSPGPETENLQQQIAQLQLQSHIQLLSGIGDRELCWLYQHCMVYVVCSSSEGFCLPLAEALYLGCKVVCSDIPILREIALSDCTYFSLQADPVEQLAWAIADTIHSPVQPNPTNQRFSKAITAKNYLDFYHHVLSSSI